MGFRDRTAVHDLQDEVAVKQRLSRRRFITSAAVSIVPSAIAMAQPKSTGLLAMIGARYALTLRGFVWMAAAPVSLLSFNSQTPLSRRFITPGNRGAVADVSAVSS